MRMRNMYRIALLNTLLLTLVFTITGIVLNTANARRLSE